MTTSSPLNYSEGTLGRKTSATLMEIEKNRQLLLAKQGEGVTCNTRPSNPSFSNNPATNSNLHKPHVPTGSNGIYSNINVASPATVDKRQMICSINASTFDVLGNTIHPTKNLINEMNVIQEQNNYRKFPIYVNDVISDNLNFALSNNCPTPNTQKLVNNDSKKTTPVTTPTPTPRTSLLGMSSVMERKNRLSQGENQDADNSPRGNLSRNEITIKKAP